MEEEKQEQPTIEGIEYSIIKSVGQVVNFAKQTEQQINKMNTVIVELAKDAKAGTLDRLGLTHLKQPIPKTPTKKATKN